jgi:tRNA pseudouridine55 synthase
VIDGVLLLDKPVGMTSNRALQQAKRLCKAKKAGHAGTLDPLASGLLLVLFGEATKFAGPLLDDDKEYRFTLRLGERTATGDAEGAVLERRAAEVSEAGIRDILPHFRGELEQVPPMYSALKSQGRPLYELAREGKTVSRRPRRIRVSRLELIGFQPPDLILDVRCSKGTYVRTLGEDIALALGTVGHLAALRRTASGAFRVEDACTLEDIPDLSAQRRERCVLGLPGLLRGLPRADLREDEEVRFRNGQTLPYTGSAGLLGVFGTAGHVIGLGRVDAGGLHPVRLTATQAAESA